MSDAGVKRWLASRARYRSNEEERSGRSHVGTRPQRGGYWWWNRVEEIRS
jgi:hypothetical protein